MLDIRTLQVALADPARLPDQLLRIERERGGALRCALSLRCSTRRGFRRTTLYRRPAEHRIRRLFFAGGASDRGKAAGGGSLQLHGAEGQGSGPEERISIGGQEYEVIGGSLSAWREISFSSLTRTEYPAIESVSVVLKQAPNGREAREWSAYLQTVFPDAGIPLPRPRDLNMATRERIQAVSAAGIGLLAVVNVSFFYAYILRRRRESYAVCSICGCTPRREVAVGLVEVTLYATALFLLCVPVYRFGIASLPFFRQYYPHGLEWMDYLFLYALYLLVILAVFGVRLYRYARRMPRNLLREGTA